MNRGLVENFLRQWRKPFGIKTICEMTGADRKLVSKVIRESIQDGRVVEMEPGIFRVKQQQVSNSSATWRYSAEVGHVILKHLQAKAYRNVRALARDMGVSRTYVQKYLAALASLGVVKWDGIQYVAAPTADLSRLGCIVEPMILTKIRRKYECG